MRVISSTVVGLVALDDVGVLDLLAVDEQVRLYLIRPPSAACTWWNRMSWFVGRGVHLTGTLTSPNDTAPLHIARIATSPTSQPGSTKNAVQCQHDGVQPMLATPGDLPVGRNGSTRWSGTGSGW